MSTTTTPTMHSRAPALGSLVVYGLALGIAAVPARAVAQSASVQAQSLFDDGRNLMKSGKVAEACAAFEASQKLDPAVTTQLNLAECRERNHQLATAWGAFVDAQRAARSAGNPKLAQVASNHARKLQPRLSRLTIAVPADHQVAGLEVVRGDVPVDPASWNHALPIDGGSYTIAARAPGRQPWSVTRTIKVEGDVQTIEIPKLAELHPAAPAGPPPVVATPAAPPKPPAASASPASAPAAPPKPPAASASAPPASTPPASTPPASTPPASTPPASTPPAAVAQRPIERKLEPPPVARSQPPPSAPSPAATASAASPGPPAASPPASSAPAETDETPPSSRARTLAIGVGAGAVALGGAALGFHLWGNRLYDRAKAATVQSDRDSLYNSAVTRRYLAQGFAGAAIAAAGVSVYFYMRSRGETQTGVALAPIVAPDAAGLAAFARW